MLGHFSNIIASKPFFLAFFQIIFKLFSFIFDFIFVQHEANLRAQNRAKIGKNRCWGPSQHEFVFWSIFDRFWALSWAPGTPKIIKHTGNKHFLKISLLKLRSIFEVNLEPTWPHFGFKNPPKSRKMNILKFKQKSTDFCIDFEANLGPKMGPCWPPTTLQDGPRGLQGARGAPPGGALRRL